ncbi:polysaccharide deacetylase [Sphingomonas parva]|uniref:Chitooligosaccharide deacetylase n=1 Tax=Sphingomonas parva TaxID=2555898 RepID=A0A4Y8ZMZ2_9SPHN|nr:polysaccharide deacetylase family protein [Sphingomonas parva]TFI57361.1 polysaccharide deacetylase [Sphingomonas parva]
MLKRLAAAAWLLGLAVTAQATEWPNGAKAAVVLSYDDALTSQLDHALPLLDAAGFKASFFLANVKEADVPRWRAAAAAGHELGNHTIFHACSAASFPADPRYTSEAYTVPSMLKEIAQQNVLLAALDGRARHGMATPCGQSVAGGTDYLEPLRAAGLVTYVRSVEASPDDLRRDAARIDPMRVPARGFPETVSGSELIAFAEQARSGGGMAVYVFHGIAGDYLQTSDAAHKALIGWLAAHRKEVWVTTLQAALDWARTHP